MNTVAYDTETKGFEWWAGQTAFIATTYDGDRERCFNMTHEVDVEDFKQQLAAADRIVAHNLSFDTHQVRATLSFDLLDLIPEGVELHDTDLMARVFLPEGSWGEHGGFGLKNLAKVYLDPTADVDEQGIKDAAKQMGMKSLKKTGSYYDIWRAYPDVMEKYAKSDARYTYDLFHLLLREYERDERLANIYDLERAVVPVLIRAEARGVYLDKPAVRKLHKQYLREQKSLHASLVTQLGEEALGGEGSEDALVEALQKQGVNLTERTDTGKLSTAKFVLDKFVSDHPVVAEYQDYRHTNKFLSTYIEPMVSANGALHPSFRQIGAWTGRMSCMRPNVQNIPVRGGDEIRRPIIARPGYSLVVIDYDAIEARLLAYYLGPKGEPFRDLINSGLDPHAWLASELAQRGVAPWAGQGKTMEDFAKGGPNDKLRSQAKTILFAIIYGAGGCKLCQYMGLPTGPPLTANDWVVQRGYKDEGEPSCAQGQAIAKAVKAALPGYNALMQRVRNKIEREGHVNTLLGRKQAVAADRSYVGMSALIQGSAADVMKAGLRDLQESLDEFNAHLLLVVHDEVVCEVPEQAADEFKRAAMVDLTMAVPLDPPLLTTGTVAHSYGDAK